MAIAGSITVVGSVASTLDVPENRSGTMFDAIRDLYVFADGTGVGQNDQVWSDPTLSPRDRSLVTVSALVAMNRPPQLRSHLGLALRNGVTEDELIGAITHLAFYSGWPNAVTATNTGKARPRYRPTLLGEP